MHIPDGFLDTKTWVALTAISGTAIAVSLKQTGKTLGEKQIPVMGITAAFIFAAQMINFPVAGGTSGHFLGAVLAAVLLGPFTAVLVMTTVLIIQCLIFQDGGVTALGANIFNMGIIGAFLGYYIFTLLNKILKIKNGFLISAFVAAWLSTVIASAACACELSISGTVPLETSLIAMTGVHAIIGIGEGLITVAVLSFIKKTRPDLLRGVTDKTDATD